MDGVCFIMIRIPHEVMLIYFFISNADTEDKKNIFIEFDASERLFWNTFHYEHSNLAFERHNCIDTQISQELYKQRNLNLITQSCNDKSNTFIAKFSAVFVDPSSKARCVTNSSSTSILVTGINFVCTCQFTLKKQNKNICLCYMNKWSSVRTVFEWQTIGSRPSLDNIIQLHTFSSKQKKHEQRMLKKKHQETVK